MSYDVVIVGGGPAGLATSIALGELGLRIALCEPAPGADKVCGEGIMPSGVRALQRLGALHALHAAPALTGVRFVAPSGVRAEAAFDEGPGRVVRRPELVQALHARRAAFAGVELIQERASAFERHRTELRVRVGSRWLTGRLLIGADGLGSRVRSWAGLSSPLDAEGGRWGARQHFAVRPWTRHVEVYFGDGLEAYVSGSGPERLGVTILWDRARTALRGGNALVRRALAAFPELERRLARARACTPQLAVGPLQRRARRAYGDGVLLVGDAAGYCDAITGEGISLALCSALAQAPALAAAVAGARSADRVVDAAALRAAVRLDRRQRRRNQLVTRTLLALARRPAALERAVALFAAEPAVFRHFLSANMGLVSPFRLPLSTLVRVLAVPVLLRAGGRPTS